MHTKRDVFVAGTKAAGRNRDRNVFSRARAMAAAGWLAVGLASLGACHDLGEIPDPFDGTGHGGPVGGVGTPGGAAGAPGGAAGAPGGLGGFGGIAPPSSGGGAGGGAVGPAICDAPPPVVNDLAPWRDDATPRTLEGDLAWVTGGMPGDWRGFVTTPWIPTYEVRLSFTANGGYAARCTWSSNMCCVAFYYGTDDDSALKTYTIDSITTAGKVGGTIDIIFGTALAGYYESGYQGVLKNVVLDATGNRLRFDFWNGGEYGPVQFDLQRLTAPENR
ncbi:MAG TPA: hypothetical protein VGP07_05480 [Polyangia bacterium]